jgi:hypothetical protein
MGDTGDTPLETAGCRNGLVSGARPRSRPLPRRAPDPGTWKRDSRKGATNSGAREGTDAPASAGTPSTSRVRDHLGDVGVRFGGSEPRRDPGQGPPAPFPLRWDASPPRPGMSDGGSPRPLRQRPVALDLLRQGEPPVPMKPDSFGCQAPSSRGSPDAGLGRHCAPARMATDLLRQAPNHPSGLRTCFGRPTRPDPASPRPLRRSTPAASAADALVGDPAPRYPLRQAPHEGGRARGARFSGHHDIHFGERRDGHPKSASTSFGGGRFHIGFGRCERYPRGFRRPRSSATVAPVTARPRGCPAASAAGRSTPALLPRKTGGPRGTAQAGSTRRRTPTNLFATLFESPGYRAGETGRMDGNGKEATTAVMRHGC